MTEMIEGRNVGWKTTEFWLSLLSTIVGAIFASGLPSEHILMRTAGIGAVVLNSLGYTITRVQLKKEAIKPISTPSRVRRASATIIQE